MSIVPPPAILMVQPPSVEMFPEPPTTLSNLTDFLSSIGSRPFDGHLPAEAESGSPVAFLNLLQQAADAHGTSYCCCQHLFQPAWLGTLVQSLRVRPNPLRLSLNCRIDASDNEKPPVLSSVEAIVQLQWWTDHHLPDLGYFKTVSRAGIWNHLILDGPAATAVNRNAVARQPNIIHSWEAAPRDGQDQSADDGYGELPALPGQPLWQVVGDPVHRFVLIDRFGKNWLMRSRADNGRILTLGPTMTFHFCPPDQLPPGYLDHICAMVAAGGTVAATHVRSNLQRAYLIGYVLENGMIVANSSLKHPRKQYIEDVRRQSGLDLSGFVERGYTSVRPEYRGLGLGTRLLEGLTARAGDHKIFSVIAEDNEATKIIARRNRTRQVAGYFSEKAGKPVGIWMPEGMIDSHEQKKS